MNNRTCSISGCSSNHHARGWCSRHYSAWRNTGDATSESERHYRTPATALSARTSREGDCLIWIGSKTRAGYGFISVDGRIEMTHRYAWIVANGDIPDGSEVDHSCGVRACCEIEHLRLATRRQNMRNRSGAASTSLTGVRNVRAEGKSFRVIVNRKHVGTFSDMASARHAAREARLVEFGEFAGKG